MDIQERFQLVVDDYLKFYRIEFKRSQRPDLHAFLLLDELFPNTGRYMVSESGHDKFYLEPDGTKLGALTDDHILELVRCGVLYDNEFDCLAMFT